MIKRLCIAISVVCLALGSAAYLFAHGGGLDANGGHTNRKTGEYHTHRQTYKPKPSRSTSTRPPASKDKWLKSLAERNLQPTSEADRIAKLEKANISLAARLTRVEAAVARLDRQVLTLKAAASKAKRQSNQ